MPTTRQMIEDMNYYNDRRTRALEAEKWYVSFDEDRETATVDLGPCPDCDRDENDYKAPELEPLPVVTGERALLNGKQVTVLALDEDDDGPYADVQYPNGGRIRRADPDDLSGMPRTPLTCSDFDTVANLAFGDAVSLLSTHGGNDAIPEGLDETEEGLTAVRKAVQEAIEAGKMPAAALDTYACETCRKRVQLATVRTRYEVCDLCNGRGSHVNPSIDAGGISSDDEFWEGDFDDETGESRYWRGDYDVPCYACGGKRVVPVPADNTDPTVIKAIDERARDAAAFAAERDAERRFGC